MGFTSFVCNLLIRAVTDPHTWPSIVVCACSRVSPRTESFHFWNLFDDLSTSITGTLTMFAIASRQSFQPAATQVWTSVLHLLGTIPRNLLEDLCIQ